MMLRVLSAVILGTGSLLAGIAPDYALDPLANSSGGHSGGSASYSLVSATTAGGHGSSGGYTAFTGFAGQLGMAQGITLSASALAMAETETLQLSAEMNYDDGSSSPLSAGNVSWGVVFGPVASISAGGLAAAAPVYQDTPAAVRASAEGVSGELALSVLNTHPDNYDTYAADGLPDTWQVEYFGLGSLLGGQDADFDGDKVRNLVEFATGTDPSRTDSGPLPLRMSGSTLLSRGQPVVEYLPAPNVLPHRVLFIRRKDAAALRLSYAPRFSRDLVNWSNATTPQTVIADDGTWQVVSVRFPVLIGGARSGEKFFRLYLSITTP